jgi:hypothetical protein
MFKKLVWIPAFPASPEEKYNGRPGIISYRLGRIKNP